MKVNGIQVEIVPKETGAVVVPPLSGDALYKAQHIFRKRITDILQRAVGRRQDVFEMAGLDNRFPDFPLVGAAKTAAQEIFKISKQNDNPVTKIKVSVAQADVSLYKETFEGYIRHLQNDLGKEPFPTVDIIIELPEGIVLIERSNPPYGWALPGGFLDPGEDAKTAAIREAKEETGLDLDRIRELGVYDKPGRDPRFLTSSTVFIAQGKGKPQFGDDAKGLAVIGDMELLQREYAFDHKQILTDYFTQR